MRCLSETNFVKLSKISIISCLKEGAGKIIESIQFLKLVENADSI
jgi:hypothetical protein